ncbi:Chemotaxis regulator BdlA [Hartmannibacter diazotrophicus]|uniref:Chemotaxis regulator BdlA n=1 Tax=Hartmannibacter diazotrophicus TaxID=1482074 RepID=A0A2C9D6D9_9HYPH|nr:methyl-accepting chemotaxis protein [Hartmannibacter diazotrophicus]SON55085.1 Chemotaxis regulator BdlA [Hartmannibacter diazotrophicus]
MSESPVTINDLSLRAQSVRDVAFSKVNQIRTINRRMRILALNALIEAERAGEVGRGFAIVSQEVRGISTEVDALSDGLEDELAREIGAISTLADAMAKAAQGTRLVDLALNGIEIVDRNLYERTCDVRWWATDSAFVACAEDPTAESCRHASNRLAVILGAYTVYLDLWLCDMDGKVLANGRPDRYRAAGADVSHQRWFREGIRLATGDDFHAEDVDREPLLENAMVATYVTPVRAGGNINGKAIGLLAIHFDWEAQAQTIVDGVRLSDEERQRSRVLIVDRSGRTIAASDKRGVLSESVAGIGQAANGYTIEGNALIAWHLTPGYETYRGLGWRGVIVQQLR